MTSDAPPRRMLVFDSAYTHRMIVERNLAPMVTGRDLGGFFEHIWTIHPVAALLSPEDSPERIGKPKVHALAPGHSFIEGRMGRFRALRSATLLNFAFAQLGLLRLAVGIVRREGVGVIRAEDSWYNGLMAWAVARLTGRPLMIGVWGNPGEIRRQTGRPVMARLFRTIRVEEAVERFVLRRADVAMAQNEDNRRFLVQMGAPPERTVIFRLGNVLHRCHFADPATREPPVADLQALGVRDGDEILLCISRLEALKLTDHVVQALGLLKARRPRAKLLFLGEGTQQGELARLAEELGIADRVIFAGNRDQLWMAGVLPRVSAVISPLTGRALAEAALGAAPIAAYDLDWHGELIRSGETGELVPRHDIPALADAVERLLSDPARARRLGANARRLALAMMDPDAVDEAQREVYRRALAREPVA